MLICSSNASAQDNALLRANTGQNWLEYRQCTGSSVLNINITNRFRVAKS